MIRHGALGVAHGFAPTAPERVERGRWEEVCRFTPPLIVGIWCVHRIKKKGKVFVVSSNMKKIRGFSTCGVFPGSDTVPFDDFYPQ